ncbi:MAG: ATP-grasp domain-containing protein [Clostridia bacterium]|nr:ATP-grasp domain-containing protein [Clostridia bacterium]
MKKITPVLLGADLNCYSVARAFHEAYGVRSHAFGKYRVGESAHSKIIKFYKTEHLENNAVLCKTLERFARKHGSEELYLVPCTDEYAEAVINCADFLRKYYFFSCPSKNLAEKLISKDAFYKMCAAHGLPFPKTEVFCSSRPFSVLKALPFPYPIIIKPSSSIEYWRAPFDGMKKVYIAHTPEEAESIIKKIFAAGYKNSIILQELIEGGESDMYVFTAYSDKNAKVCAASMGHVLLGEHTPKGLGNHVAIITEYHEEITQKLCSFLESIGYRGFSNFDIIFDRKEGAFKLLEINLRQGRSNYYVTASGANIARILVCDRHGSLNGARYICRESFFWHTVPKSIIYKYIADKELEAKARALDARGKSGTSLFYAKDLCFNPVRAAYALIHNLRYFGKYKIYG